MTVVETGEQDTEPEARDPYATPLLAGEDEDDGVERHIWRGTD